ncbi:MAG: TetR/AcrR family transcriptional regulator [Fidelibacterota bacterium]
MPKIVNREEKKIEILQVAINVFYEHGIEQRSMKHIAEDLGMGRSSLYSYFKSREDILHFTLSYAIRHFDMISVKLLKSDDPVPEKIARLFSSSFYDNENIKKAVTVVIEYLLLLRRKKKVLDLPVHDLSRHIRGLFKSLLEQGIERAELRQHDTEKLSNVLYALTESMLLNGTFEDNMHIIADHSTVRMILSGILLTT